MPLRCFIDTETTGTDPKRHGVIQIGIVIDGMTRFKPVGNGPLTGAKLVNLPPERLNITCKPFPGDEIDPVALEVNHHTIDEIMAFQTPMEAKKKVCSFLDRFVDKYNKQDKLFFLGYNAQFDQVMLRAWWEKCGDEYFGSYFWSPPIDVMSLAANHLMDKRPSMKDFKQGTVAEALGITLDPAALHDAAFDAEISRQIYNHITR